MWFLQWHVQVNDFKTFFEVNNFELELWFARCCKQTASAKKKQGTLFSNGCTQVADTPALDYARFCESCRQNNTHACRLAQLCKQFEGWVFYLSERVKRCKLHVRERASKQWALAPINGGAISSYTSRFEIATSQTLYAKLYVRHWFCKITVVFVSACFAFHYTTTYFYK